MQVERDGSKAEIPEWAVWIAQDEDGTWCVYNYRPEPRRSRHGGYWGGDYADNNRAIIIEKAAPNRRWQETLEKLEGRC